MAYRLIERLRGKVPYIRRLHREIDDLRHQLAVVEQQPLLDGTAGVQSTHIGNEFRTFLRLLQPHDVRGLKKLRVGAKADGGYVMLNDFAPVRHALSLGVGAEVSWDSGMAARGLRVFQYDNTVIASPQTHEKFFFHRKRVVGIIQEPEDITLAQIMTSDALKGDNNVVAKIDIEGHEWAVLANTDSNVLAHIRQCVVEFHEMRHFIDEAWRHTAFGALRNLISTHCCIHVHGNNWGPFAVVGGVPFPNAFEATFVRRADHETVPSAAVFPTELDRPCNPKKPDLYLGRWNY